MAATATLMAAKLKPAICIGETLSALLANGLLLLAEAEAEAEPVGAMADEDVEAGEIIWTGIVVLVLVSLDMKTTCKGSFSTRVVPIH
jgi:hypothetical protein